MLFAQVKGINETIDNLTKYQKGIVLSVKTGIQISGDQAVTQLSNEYPDFIITGQFFPDTFEYWITIHSKLKGPLIVICSRLGQRMDISKQEDVGQQPGKGLTPYTRKFYIKDITDRIGENTVNNIRTLIDEVLK